MFEAHDTDSCTTLGKPIIITFITVMDLETTLKTEQLPPVYVYNSGFYRFSESYIGLDLCRFYMYIGGVSRTQASLGGQLIFPLWVIYLCTT